MKIRQKRVLAYVLAMVMVLNLCAVPVKAEGTKQEITVTVTLDTWTYGTDSSKPKVTIKAGATDITSSYTDTEATFAYKYYTDQDCKKETTTANGAAKEGEVPQNAGTYYVKVVVPEKDTYASGEATCKFTIGKANITPTLKSGWTSTWTEGDTKAVFPEVDGNSGNGKVTYWVNGGVYTEYTEISSESDLQKLVPGNYTIKAKVGGTQNYNEGETEACNFTVEAKKAITVTVELNNWTYGDTPNEPTVTKIEAGVTDITSSYKDVTFDYKYYVDSTCETLTTKDNSGAQTEGGVPGNAGTYYVKVTVPELGDYAEGEESCKFTIAKGNINPTLKADWKKTWTEGATDIALPGVENNSGKGEVTYYVKEKDADDTTYKVLTLDELKKLTKGEYTIKAKVGETQNYNVGETKPCNFTVEAKKDNPSPSENPATPTKDPLPSVTPAPTVTPSVQPTDGIKINGKDVKNNQKISVSLGTSITITASSKITIVPKAKKNQKKCLKVSVKNNKGTIKVNSLCKNAIKVIITEKSKKTSTTIWINTKVPIPKFTVKINKARTRITFKIKNKSVAKKIGCYTIEASRKNAFSYVTTNKFILTNSDKFSKGKYSFRIRFWNTKKPVKKGKLLTKKYLYSEQVQKLKVR